MKPGCTWKWGGMSQLICVCVHASEQIPVRLWRCVCLSVCFDVCICLFFFMCLHRLVLKCVSEWFLCVFFCVCVYPYVCRFVFVHVPASLCRSIHLWLWSSVVCVTVDVFCVAKLCLLYSRWPAVLRVPVFEPAGSCIHGDGAWCWRDGADESCCSSNW